MLQGYWIILGFWSLENTTLVVALAIIRVLFSVSEKETWNLHNLHEHNSCFTDQLLKGGSNVLAHTLFEWYVQIPSKVKVFTGCMIFHLFSYLSAWFWIFECWRIHSFRIMNSWPYTIKLTIRVGIYEAPTLLLISLREDYIPSK